MDYVIRESLEKNIRDQYQGKVVVLEGKFCEDTGPDQQFCIEPYRIISVE